MNASPKKKRSHELPPVAGRLEITSLLDYVDESLEYLPRATLHLDDPQVRERFRGWLHDVVSGYLHHLQFELSKGADRGIGQVLQLARDPDYYLKASERRKQRRAQWRLERQAEPVAPPPVQLMPKGIELAQAEFGIYHVDTFETPGFQISLIGAANTQAEAERFIAEKFGPRSQGQRISERGADLVELVHMTPMGEPVIIKTWNVG